MLTAGRKMCPGAVWVKANVNAEGMRREAFSLGERDGGGSDAMQGRVIGGGVSGALQEVEHGEAGGELGGAAGRQDVVGAGDVISDRFGRVRAEEDGASVADLAEHRIGVGEDELQVFWGEAVGEGGGLEPVADQDNGTVGAPACAGDVGAG